MMRVRMNPISLAAELQLDSMQFWVSGVAVPVILQG